MNKPLLTVRPPLLLTIIYIIIACAVLVATIIFAAMWDINILYPAVPAAVILILLLRHHVTMKIYYHYLVVGTPLSKRTLSLYQINTISLGKNSILIETSFKKYRYSSISLANTSEVGKLLAGITPGLTVINPATEAVTTEKPDVDTQADDSEPAPDQTPDPKRRVLLTAIIFIISLAVGIISQQITPLLTEKSGADYDWALLPTSYEGAYVDVLTDGSEAEALYLANVMDGLVRHINDDYLPLPLNQRPRALMFMNEDNYLLFSGGNNQGTYGYYNPHLEAIVVNTNLGIGTTGHVLMYHYYAHLFTPSPGTWFGRGLATHFEKFTGYLEDGHAEITTGYFHPRRFRAAKAQIINADLAKLISSRQEHDDLANSFMLFMHHQGLLAAYIKANETGQDDLTVLPEIYGAPIEQIEQDWKFWVISTPVDEYLDLLMSSVVYESKDEFDLWLEDNQLTYKDGRYQKR